MSKKNIQECIRDNLEGYFQDLRGAEPDFVGHREHCVAVELEIGLAELGQHVEAVIPQQADHAILAAMEMLENLDAFRRDYNCPRRVIPSR